MTMNKTIIRNELKDYIGITLALVLYAFGFTFFLMPYEIVTGGVAGIAAIVYYATSFPNSYTYFLINASLLVVALKILGVKFLMKTIYATLMLSFLLWFMKEIAPVDEAGNMIKILGEGQDFMSLLIGCLMTGTALGLTFLYNGSTGGTDIIAASINKYHDFSLGTILIFADFIIIGSCLFIPQFGTFLERMTMVVFGFCTMIIENFMLDYIMNRQRQSVQFMIFSKKYQEIAKALAMQTDHTMTILDGHGWYSGKEVKVIVLLAKKSESVTIFRIVKMIDPNAFVSQSAVIGVFGEGFDKIKVKVKREHIEKAGMMIDNQDIDTDIKQ
ncbi:MAG: YitT family protein [Prevotella sp.]|nr:YitT family protein [Prevotella sp.]MBR4601087.1 YitT family protein [Prevotella sp.]MBR6138019.1 YitT family protein [Prevotella sp.]